MFQFSERQLETMTANFERRRSLMADLFPWDDPNFGVDHRWARFSPYAAATEAGKTVDLALVILNHSPREQRFRVTPHAPAGWKFLKGPLSVSIGPRQEKSISVPITAASGAHGTVLVTADIAFGSWDLREWAEAVVTAK
jgi:hypothetical protein